MKKIFKLCAPAFAVLFCASAMFAQDTAKLSDEHWELWRQGIESYEEGEFAVQDKKYEQAVKYFNQSLESLKKVRSANPSWNKNVMNYRISVLERKIKGTEEKIADMRKRANPVADKTDTEIAALRKALADTRKELSALRLDAERGKTASAEVASLLKEKEATEQKLATLMLQYNTLKLKAESNVSSDTENALRSEKQRSAVMEKTVTSLKDENLTLLKQIQTLSASMIENDKAAREYAAKAARVDELEKSLSILRDRMTAAEAEVKNSSSRAAAERAKIAEELAKKTSECELLAEQVRKLRAGMKLDDAARALEAEAVTLRAENDRMNRETASLKNELKKLKDMSAKNLDGATHRDSIMKSLSDRNTLLSSELEKLKKAFAAKDAELSENAKSLSAAKAENERISKELKVFAHKINNMPSASVSSDAVEKRFREEVKKLEAQLAESSARVSAFEKEKASLVKENKSLKENLDKLSGASADASAAENELRKLVKERAVLTEKLAKLSEAEKGRRETLEVNAALKKELVRMDEKFAVLKKDADKAAVILESENLRLKEQTEALTTELASVKKVSASSLEIAEKAKKTSAENAGLKNELDALRRKYDLLASEAAKDSRRITSEAKSRTDEMAKTLSDYEAKLASAAKNAEGSRKVAEEIALERNRISAENAELKKNLAVMKTKAARADEIIESEALLSATIQENKLLKARYDKLKDEKKDPASEQAARDANAKLEITEKKLEESLDKIESLEKDLESLKTAMVAKSDADTKALKAVKDELAESRKAFDALNKTPSAEALAMRSELEKKIKTLTESEKKLAETVVKDSAALKKLELEKTEALNELRKVKDSASKLTAARDSELEKTKTALGEAKKALKSAVNTEQYKTLEKALVVSEKRNDELLAELQKMKMALVKNTDLGRTLEVQSAEIEKLKRALEQKNASNADADIVKKLTARVEAGAAEIESLRKKLAEKAVSTSPAAATPAESSKRIAELTASLEKLSVENARLTKQMESVSGDSSRLKTLAPELVKLKDERAVFITELEKARKELARAKDELEKVRKAADDRSEIELLKSELEKARKSISDMKKQASSAADPSIELKERLANMEKQLDDANKKISRQSLDLRKYESSPDSVMKERLAKKDQAIDELMKEHTSLSNEISELKNTLKNLYGKALKSGVKPDSDVEKLFPGKQE